MDQILNFNIPLNIELLDNIVTTFYSSNNKRDREAAQLLLTEFQKKPEAWSKVDQILQYSKNSQTKFFALGILEEIIKYKWNALADKQKEGIKNFVVNIIIQISSDQQQLHKEKMFVGKLNLILVQILKQQWPKGWSSFIPEIVGSSKTNESLCENNMIILKLFSEEIFNFSGGQMTTVKINELRNGFVKEFSLIYQLCELILEKSQKPSLIHATLTTLLGFLTWIPEPYIFQTKMIETLICKFFPVELFQNTALQCLSEISALETNQTNKQSFGKLFALFMMQIEKIVSHTFDFSENYSKSSNREQKFVNHFTIFLTTLFKNHLTSFESDPQLFNYITIAHYYLANITKVPELEVFKITLEYWKFLGDKLYKQQPKNQLQQYGNQNNGNGSSYTQSYSTEIVVQNEFINLYLRPISLARSAIISRMAKPEEVIIVEDDNGDWVKEETKDTDAIVLYNNMRETLIYLTHLDPTDTQNIMADKLEKQCNGAEWSFHNLNTLCWAIGSISGALDQEQEKKFLVFVIKELLGLCENKKGKNNKAVVASNIMYVVGQYPRFLKAHWRFLKTVVNKLFEFMHETHPGVKDMSCETFLKIANKCKDKFVVKQNSEKRPFIEQIISDTSDIISDLKEPQQIQLFYEAVSVIISANNDKSQREILIVQLMALPNKIWQELMLQAKQNVQCLQQPNIAKSITNILKTNIRVAKSLSNSYIIQLGRIYIDVLKVYTCYSNFISTHIQQQGTIATKSSLVRNMRSVKRSVISLLTTFISESASNDPQNIIDNFVPPLLEAVLLDYTKNIPDARDSEVLILAATIVKKLKENAQAVLPQMFSALFECTLQMIQTNFQDYPDHRKTFFAFLESINTHCFGSLLSIGTSQPSSFKLYYQSIIWAIKHTEREISEKGLSILIEFWNNISSERTPANFKNSFYTSYYLDLLQNIFLVVTDTFHKTSFKPQAKILMMVLHSVENGFIQVPISPNQQSPNPIFLKQYLANLLNNFGTLTREEISHFIIGATDLNKTKEQNKKHLRDFLIRLKEFSNSDNSELFIEETEIQQKQQKNQHFQNMLQIPGMISQYDPRYIKYEKQNPNQQNNNNNNNNNFQDDHQNL